MNDETPNLSHEVLDAILGKLAAERRPAFGEAAGKARGTDGAFLSHDGHRPENVPEVEFARDFLIDPERKCAGCEKVKEFMAQTEGRLFKPEDLAAAASKADGYGKAKKFFPRFIAHDPGGADSLTAAIAGRVFFGHELREYDRKGISVPPMGMEPVKVRIPRGIRYIDYTGNLNGDAVADAVSDHAQKCINPHLARELNERFKGDQAAFSAYIYSVHAFGPAPRTRRRLRRGMRGRR